MKAAIYCRVSTDNQEKEGTSLQTQLQACLKYCESKQYEVTKQFSETYSGLELHRPQLDQMRELLGTEQVDRVVVYCLDRLSRDPTHGVLLMQELEKSNVVLEAVTESVDSSELGKLISYIRGFSSKLEAEKIRERTMRGKLAFVRQGKLPQGTGIGIYGYSWDKTTGKRVIIDQETEIVRRIFNLRISGSSTNQIATLLNKESIPSKSGSLWFPLTVRRILSNQAYAGKTYYGQSKRVSRSKVIAQPRENWTLLPDVTPQIITDEVFQMAQEAARTALEHRPLKPNSHYLLSGFLRCPKCGSRIGGTTLNGKYRYYQCQGARPTATRAKMCNAGYIKADDIERVIWEHVICLSSSPYTGMKLFIDTAFPDSDKVMPLLDRQIDQLKAKIRKYPTKEKSLYDLLTSEAVTKDYVLDAVTKLKSDQDVDNRQLEQLQQQRQEISKADNVHLKISQAWKNLHKSIAEAKTLEDRRRWLETLKVKVVALPGNYQFSCFLDADITSEDLSGKIKAEYAEKMARLKRERPDLFANDSPRQFGDFLRQAEQVKDLVTIEQTWA